MTTQQNSNTQSLSKAGVSIWLDDLSKTRIESGNLAQLIAELNVVGVTTNPTIFAAALSNSAAYSKELKQLKEKGATAEETVFSLSCADVAAAAKILRPVYDNSKGYDGRVSIEVAPTLAYETEKTITQAKELWQQVNEENVMIKIPATKAGLPAITEVIASGISVNVTLIFSVQRYLEVISAYVQGIKKAAKNGIDVSKIHSVASFFISRVDTEVNSRIEGNPSAQNIKNKVGIANAKLAYKEFENFLASDEAKELEKLGANIQRPLWASTGVKDASLPDTLYVSEIVAPLVVNTMPENTLLAVADHGETIVDSAKTAYDNAQEIINSLSENNISYDEVVSKLEDEGVQKFIDSWNDLLAKTETALEEI